MVTETRVKCTCKGLQDAIKDEMMRMRHAGMMGFVRKAKEVEMLHGGWEKCKCKAAKVKQKGDMKILSEEVPGGKYRDPEKRDVSILMGVVASMANGPTHIFARWSYSVECFMPEYQREVYILGPLVLKENAKLWYPVPKITSELMEKCFPVYEKAIE